MTDRTISEIYHLFRAGTPLESIIPDGADIAIWRQMMAAKQANEGRPARKNTPYRGRSGGKPSKRQNYAAQVVGRAMAELVTRVNGKEGEEKR